MAKLALGLASFALATALDAQARPSRSIQNDSGLQLLIVSESFQPALRIVLPGRPISDRTIEVLFPEHVTAIKRGSGIAEQLYQFRPGPQGERPIWLRTSRTMEYQRDLVPGLHLAARAILEDDGVRFQYSFTNETADAYDMIYAVTDPRLTFDFHDERLERTYVHHSDGFELLASETPNRLSMPLSEWLPTRYLASFKWPIPARRVDRREDGITYYNKSRRVDEPFIATLSKDSTWVVASFSRDVGNVWSNPQLTCQHVDPQISLAPGQVATMEVKMLILRGSLDDALRRARAQRALLK
jgi:hypothetical protein